MKGFIWIQKHKSEELFKTNDDERLQPTVKFLGALVTILRQQPEGLDFKELVKKMIPSLIWGRGM